MNLELSDETKVGNEEESKFDVNMSRAKSSSTVLNPPKIKTWTPISVREAGDLSSAPNYRLFSQCNSIGCVALDENCILLFGGKENIRDGELDQ